MGGIFDGRYIYLVPLLNISYHGNILRYDTRGEFKNSNNWQAYNAGNIDGLNTIGYAGAVFDGKFIYFVPHTDASASYHGKVLRYDSNGEFKNSNSWRYWHRAK